MILKANPKLRHQKDADEREIIHWACSYNRIEVVKLLMAAKDFDIDVQVRRAYVCFTRTLPFPIKYQRKCVYTETHEQDGSSGYTPLMFAVSIQDGDDLVDLLLSKGADINTTSKHHLVYQFINHKLRFSSQTSTARRRCTSQPPRTTLTLHVNSLSTRHLLVSRIREAHFQFIVRLPLAQYQ